LSEKSVAHKLLVREGHKVLILNPPRGYKEKNLGSLPKTAVFLKDSKGPADVIQVFVSSKKELEEQLAKLKPSLGSTSILWVTYPKGTSKIKSDVNRDVIREYAPTVGLEAVSIFSVDDDWSALRLKLV